MHRSSSAAVAAPAELRSTIGSDLLASIVVFLVALPLCMGIAIAADVPVAAGLVTGIVGGLIVGTLSGCPLQVSGPTAGQTMIIYQLVQDQGLEMLGPAVIIAGLIQIAAGSLRLGQWLRAVSPAVIHGMLAGMGILIFASQFHVMVDDKPKGTGVENLASIPQAVWKGLGAIDFQSEEVRQVRVHMLRETGELHRRQVAIQEDVSLIAPPHFELPVDEASVDSIQALAPLQYVNVEQLNRFAARLEEIAPRTQLSDKTSRIIQTERSARQATGSAFRALESGDLESATATQSEAVTVLQQLRDSLKSHGLAARIGLLTIATLLLWQTLAPRRLRVVPAPLVAVIVATAVAGVLWLPVLYVEVPDRLLDDIHPPTWAILQAAPWGELLRVGMLLAMVASAETLLCATAVDQMHFGPRTRYNRELLAQGVGNMICGGLGALPMAGVIVRSAANVNAGGKTRLSTILHGLWLLVFVVGLGFLLRMIPTSALAAMLVYTGYKLVDIKAAGRLLHYGWGEVFIYAMTVTTIVAVDLLAGVLVGVGLSAIKLLLAFSGLRTSLELNEVTSRAELKLDGAATFLRLPHLAGELERVPRGYAFEIDYSRLHYIDHACLDLLINWCRQHEAAGGLCDVDWRKLEARFQSAQD